MGHPIDSGLSYFFLMIIFLGISVSIKCKLKERFYELLSDKPGQVTSSFIPIKFQFNKEFIQVLIRSFCCSDSWIIFDVSKMKNGYLIYGGWDVL